MNVMVTGGTGVAGRYVIKALAEAGHTVTNVDRVQDDRLPCERMTIDLTSMGEVYDAFAQIKPESVCHLAAQPRAFGFSREQTFINNTAITYNVFQVAGEMGVRRIINSSSEMAIGWSTNEGHPDKLPINENERIDSPNAYALGKYVSEVMADSFVVRHPEMAICSMRISAVIEPERLQQLVQSHQENYPQAGSGNYWSYIQTEDLAAAYLAALKGETTGHEVYLLANDDITIDVPIREALEERFGIGDRLAKDHGAFQSAFDCSKLKRDFNWKPTHSWRHEQS